LRIGDFKHFNILEFLQASRKNTQLFIAAECNLSQFLQLANAFRKDIDEILGEHKCLKAGEVSNILRNGCNFIFL
jgi:hypothetical protein